MIHQPNDKKERINAEKAPVGTEHVLYVKEEIEHPQLGPERWVEAFRAKTRPEVQSYVKSEIPEHVEYDIRPVKKRGIRG